MIKINKIIIVLTILILIKLKMVTPNKYCSLQSVTGQSRYFMCGRHEYCCTFGCCVHLAFQFYQLWYYWLLLIFMFMVCSGGSWWYRFCRQNDSTGSIRSQIPGSDTGSYYGANHHLLHSTPTRTSNTMNGTRHSATTSANDYERRVTLVRNNGVHSYYYRNGRSPSYYDTGSVRYHNGATGDRTLRRYQQQQQHQQHPHQANFLPRPELCPYYQLYGPPPSYESVVQLSADNSSTLCTLGDPLSTVAPITNDESSVCANSTLITPTVSSLSSTQRIIQPIVTVNLSNALSTSIEVRPICSASGNLSLGDTQQSQAACLNTTLNHIEVVQSELQNSLENPVNFVDESGGGEEAEGGAEGGEYNEINNKIIDTTNNLKILNSIKTEPIIIEDENLCSDILDDQKQQIHENRITTNTTTTTTTIVPLSFRTNFLMRNEKNSIPSVCSSSISNLTTAQKYCNSDQQLQKFLLPQQHQLQQQHQHQQQQQQPTTSASILNDFDNTQCTCSIGSLASMSTSSSSSTTSNKSLIELNKSKFLKSSKFNRKYYKNNSNSSGLINNSSSSSISSTSSNNNNNSHISNSINNCGMNNCNRTDGIGGELINSPNSLNSVDRSVIDDNLVSNPNDIIQQTAAATTEIVTTTSSSVTVATAKMPSNKH